MPPGGLVLRLDRRLCKHAQVRERAFHAGDALTGCANVSPLLAVKPSLTGQGAILLKKNHPGAEDGSWPVG